MTPPDALPVIEYRDIAECEPATLEALRSTCHLTGFFYLRHPRLLSGPTAEMFRHAVEFFSLPLADKNEIHLSRSPHYRGYSALDEERTQGAPDHKETLDLGLEAASLESRQPYHTLQGPNQWPAALPGFRPAAEAYLREMGIVGHAILRTLALALDLPEDTFARHFKPPFSMLRLISYPPTDGDPANGQGIGEHTDFGCLTILAQNRVSGLEVRRADGTWIPAPARADCFVVNLGDMLETWTGHYFVATPHRVRSPGGRQTRYSIPFFFEPSLDALVTPLPREKLPPFERDTFREGPAAPIVYGEHILAAFRRSYPEVGE